MLGSASASKLLTAKNAKKAAEDAKKCLKIFFVNFATPSRTLRLMACVFLQSSLPKEICVHISEKLLTAEDAKEGRNVREVRFLTLS